MFLSNEQKRDLRSQLAILFPGEPEESFRGITVKEALSLAAYADAEICWNSFPIEIQDELI